MWETKAEGEIRGGGVEKRRKNRYQYAGRCEGREMETAQSVMTWSTTKVRTAPASNVAAVSNMTARRRRNVARAANAS